MAEVVELHIEEAIPELESMLTVLFSEEEIKLIVKSREDLEYKLNKPDKDKEDFLKYIDQEVKLLKMVRIRHKQKDLQKSKLANIEMAITGRIQKVFVISVRLFPDDVRLWLSYFRYCKVRQMYAATSRVLEQMLEYHGSSIPELYKFAASWELNECKNLDKARSYLLSGLHLHKGHKDLLKDAFHLELLDTAQRRKEYLRNHGRIDRRNHYLTTKQAECIYECSVKKMKDVEMMHCLVNICEEFDFASDLQTKIYTEMFEFESSERMWDIIATRELNSNTDDKLPAKVKIGKCVELYETAVKRLNTSVMWAYYIDALIEMNKDTTVLPNFKRKLLMTALQKAASHEKLNEKYYHIWASYLQGADKHKKLVEVLQMGVKQLPQSCSLWQTLVRTHLSKNEEKQAHHTFEMAVATLGKDSLPLWKVLLMYEQTKRNSKVDDIFKKSLNQCKEITDVLKPMYLEWLTLTHGIGAARKVYAELVDSPPPCLQLHKKMVYLEAIQPNMNLKRMRFALTRACADFGEKDIGVWIDICKFEIKCGDVERISGIYWQARQNLIPQMVETFLAQFSLIHSIPHPPTQ